MTNQSTVDKLLEMRLTSMSDAYITQTSNPKMKEVSFCNLRTPTDGFAEQNGRDAERAD